MWSMFSEISILHIGDIQMFTCTYSQVVTASLDKNIATW